MHGVLEYLLIGTLLRWLQGCQATAMGGIEHQASPGNIYRAPPCAK
jgi:hypothetical protein